MNAYMYMYIKLINKNGVFFQFHIFEEIFFFHFVSDVLQI